MKDLSAAEVRIMDVIKECEEKNEKCDSLKVLNEIQKSIGKQWKLQMVKTLLARMTQIGYLIASAEGNNKTYKLSVKAI